VPFNLSRDNVSYDAALYMETYQTLINCSVTVAAACSIDVSSKVYLAHTKILRKEGSETVN
jgi:hypothetical protein